MREYNFPDDAAEVYTKAKDILRKGWTTREYRDGTDYCLMGAVCSAAGVEYTDRAFAETEREYGYALDAVTMRRYEEPAYRYNDYVAQSVEDVIGVLDDAIELVKSAAI